MGEFLDVLDTLRLKCPWDRKQTNESLRPNTIEEVYELCDALIADDNENICKELGDVLLHVAFYAKIAEEKGCTLTTLTDDELKAFQEAVAPMYDSFLNAEQKAIVERVQALG